MLSYICIVISLFIPLACAIYAKFSVKGYQNQTPREFLEQQKGKQKRAHYAQLNFYETFPAFAVGILVAHQLNVTNTIIDNLAITYVSSRILFAIFYINNNHILRSICWFIAFGSILSLYLYGILQ